MSRRRRRATATASAVGTKAARAGGGQAAAASEDRRVPQRVAASWIRLGTAGLAGLLGFLWTGVLPVAGDWQWRAVACGLIVGLAARRVRELAPATVLAVAAALAGVLVACMHGGAPELAAPSGAGYATLVLLSGGVAAATGWACSRGRRGVAAAVAVAFVVALFLYQVGVLPGEPRGMGAEFRAHLAVEPPAEQYGFDGYIYLRVNHLMERGVPYYDAFVRATVEDYRIKEMPPGLFNFRQRWIYEFWRLLPGPPGVKVWYWFIVLVCGTMLAAYGLARRFVEPAAALVAPLALGGYFLGPALSPWFPLSDFWGGCLAVWFLYAMVSERWTAAAVLAVVAFSFRELMLILVPVYIAWWIVSCRRREGFAGLALVVVGPVVLIGLHMLWAPIAGQGAGGVGNWLHGGLPRLWAALRFSGDTAPKSSVTYLVAPALALAGALLTRATWTKALLGAAVAVPVVFLTLFSKGEWNYYWGAIAQPALLALAPLAAGLLLPSALSLLDAPAPARERAGAVRIILYLRDRVEHLAATAEAIAEAVGDREHAVFLVDDSAEDEAAAVIGKLESTGVTASRNESSLGFALSTAEGAAAALKGAGEGEAIVLVDAACGVSAGTVAAMVAAFDAGADVVVASRLAPGARAGGGFAARWARSALCRTISAIWRSLQPVPGLRDYTAPATLYSAEALRGACRGDTEGPLGGNRGIDVDLVARLRGSARVREVPLVADAGYAGSAGCVGSYGLMWSARALAKARLAALAKVRD